MLVKFNGVLLSYIVCGGGDGVCMFSDKEEACMRDHPNGASKIGVLSYGAFPLYTLRRKHFKGPITAICYTYSQFLILMQNMDNTVYYKTFLSILYHSKTTICASTVQTKGRIWRASNLARSLNSAIMLIQWGIFKSMYTRCIRCTQSSSSEK